MSTDTQSYVIPEYPQYPETRWEADKYAQNTFLMKEQKIGEKEIDDIYRRLPQYIKDIILEEAEQEAQKAEMQKAIEVLSKAKLSATSTRDRLKAKLKK